MRLYDLVLVLRPSLSEKDREKLLETIKGWLKDVTVKKEDVWGQKPLAYKIKQEVAGYYIKYNLEAETVPAGFEKRLLEQENVLRYLLLRTK